MNSESFDLSSISRGRSLILCTAALMVLIFHSSYQFEHSLMAFLVESGYMGVDLFLFVSGVGLYYSFSGNPDVRTFYKHRAVRILPAFLIVSVAWNLFRYPGSVKAFLENITLISFYTRGDRTFWYFALIIPLYIVYPVIHMLIQKYRGFAAAGMIVAVLVLSALFTKCFWQFSLIEIAFARIPVFICGVWLAPSIKAGKKAPAVWLWVCLAVLIGCNAILYYNIVEQITIQRFICCPIAVSWAFLLSALNEHMRKGRFYSVLIWIAGLSMELYLIQEKALALITPVFPAVDSHNIVLNLCVYPVTFFAAYLLHLLCERITGRKQLKNAVEGKVK